MPGPAPLAPATIVTNPPAEACHAHPLCVLTVTVAVAPAAGMLSSSKDRSTLQLTPLAARPDPTALNREPTGAGDTMAPIEGEVGVGEISE